jgi:hypothetical protein
MKQERMATQQDKRLFSSTPNGDGTWTLSTYNSDTGEFEPVYVAVGQVSYNDARQFLRKGKAQWSDDSMPHIVLKGGKRLLVKQ